MRSQRSIRLTLTFLLLALLPALVLAQSTYDLSWWTVDGGGRLSQGGGYTLNGSGGQADAGVLAGGGYTLAGGFWAGGAPVEEPTGQAIYLPIVENGR